MSFLDTDSGKRLFNQYLKKVNGSSQRVYRSEIQQFFDFKNLKGISDITKEVLHAYQERLSWEHSPKTTKRKFSILNGFFKHLEASGAFRNPIITLKEFKTHTGVKDEDLLVCLDKFLATQNTPNIKKSYENLIKLFFAWINKDLCEITKQDILAYRDYLRENSYRDTTIWNRFISLNRFFKYIERENRKFRNPIVFKELTLIFPKKDKGYYTVLSVSEAQRLLNQPDRKTEIGRRDYAILALMLVYGLRANETAGLRHKHLEHDRVKGQQKVWIVDRKGRFQNRPKTAIILNGKALQAFDAWMDIVKGYGIKITGELPVFLPFIYDRVDHKLVIRRDRLPGALSVKSVENIVKRYIKKAKIERDGEVLSAHSLRHTAFTMLAHEGVPIQDIQKLAGHQDINTTMIYVHSAQSYDDHPGMRNPLNK
ncbi:MAG: site-specific integrase [Candidatus Brocadia sp.]|uniref:Site-specific tyrosine recombinase n=1 Tax=Candidatus Brocadia fulgida TaxID=380242 RepID=A0A0M2UXU7_9BACT|nr:MAG: site-specific tyrosine recombinase [Candidatus Brocadia fulgida]UJS21537.1 MAG: site-specific integrase [Candidatus Brocadia sp.]